MNSVCCAGPSGANTGVVPEGAFRLSFVEQGEPDRADCVSIGHQSVDLFVHQAVNWQVEGGEKCTRPHEHGDDVQRGLDLYSAGACEGLSGPEVDPLPLGQVEVSVSVTFFQHRGDQDVRA